MIDNYDPEREGLNPEEMAVLQRILDQFKTEVYDGACKEGTASYELFEEDVFDSVVKGYVLASPGGTTMIAAWSWCWYDVVVEGRKVGDVLKD